MYEEKTINRAAKKLFITPQGLSRVIANFEQEIGVPLFTRTQKGMEPTESAHFLYEKAQTLLRDIESIENEIRLISRKDNGLRLACANGVLNALSFKTIADFINKHPELRVEWAECANAEAKNSVSLFQSDVGLVVGHSDMDNIIQIKLASREIILLVHPEHHFYERSEVSIRELEGEKIVTLSKQFQVHWELRKKCEEYGFIPNITGESADSHFVLKLCKLRAGIGVLIDFSIDDFSLDDLRPVKLQEKLSWDIYLICNERSRLSPHVKLLHEHLLQLHL